MSSESVNQFTVGVAASGKVKLHFKGELVAIGFEMDPLQAQRLGSTLQSEAHHAENKNKGNVNP